METSAKTAFNVEEVFNLSVKYFISRPFCKLLRWSTRT